MTVLVHLDPDEYDAREMSPGAIAKAAFSEVNTAYNDVYCGLDYYLADPSGPDGFRPETLAMISGRDDPDRLIAVASDWNSWISRNMATVMTEIQKATPTISGMIPDPNVWLAVPPDMIYRLKKAVMLLDNDFYPAADRAALIDFSTWCFQGHITDAQLENIKANPAQYAIIEVQPK